MKGRKKQPVKFKPAGTHAKFKEGWTFLSGSDITSSVNEDTVDQHTLYQWCSANLDPNDWCSGSYRTKTRYPSSQGKKWMWATTNGGMKVGTFIILGSHLTSRILVPAFSRKTWFMFRHESDMLACKLANL